MDREFAINVLLNKELATAIFDFNIEYWKHVSYVPNTPYEKLLFEKDPSLLCFVKQKKFFTFENKVDRFVFITDEELDALILYLGSCVFSKEISLIILKQEREDLFGIISKKIYDFALDYSRFSYDLAFVKEHLKLDFSIDKECIYKAGCYLVCVFINKIADKDLVSFISSRIKYNYTDNIIDTNNQSKRFFKLVEKILKEEIGTRWIKFLS